jgi:hypothetical protein
MWICSLVQERKECSYKCRLLIAGIYLIRKCYVGRLIIIMQKFTSEARDACVFFFCEDQICGENCFVIRRVDKHVFHLGFCHLHPFQSQTLKVYQFKTGILFLCYAGRPKFRHLSLFFFQMIGSFQQSSWKVLAYFSPPHFHAEHSGLVVHFGIYFLYVIWSNFAPLSVCKALQPFGPWPPLQFLNPIHSR